MAPEIEEVVGGNPKTLVVMVVNACVPVNPLRLPPVVM